MQRGSWKTITAKRCSGIYWELGFKRARRYSSSSSGEGAGLVSGDSRGFFRPCFKPPELSESDFSSEGGADRRGVVRGPNLADGDGPLEGESSGSTFCRGEIRE